MEMFGQKKQPFCLENGCSSIENILSAISTHDAKNEQKQIQEIKIKT